MDIYCSQCYDKSYSVKQARQHYRESGHTDFYKQNDICIHLGENDDMGDNTMLCLECGNVWERECIK